MMENGDFFSKATLCSLVASLLILTLYCGVQGGGVGVSLALSLVTLLKNEHEIGFDETDNPEPYAFNVLESVGNCHPECSGGCTEEQSATQCHSCKHLTQTLRNKAGSGFKCVTKCDDTYFLEQDRCRMCSSHCHTCTQAEVCETCPGSQLLIDVENSTIYNHGKCVDACPPGLIADYESNLVQAKCIWKKDLCGDGYYINAVGKCDLCDRACFSCTAPGPMSCDVCVKGYGKGPLGFCRPCCQEGETGYNCEDCSKLAPPQNPQHGYGTQGTSATYGTSSTVTQGGHGFLSFLVWLLALIFIGAIGVVICCMLKEAKNQIDYTPLPHYNSAAETVNIGYESDEEDEILHIPKEGNERIH